MATIVPSARMIQVNAVRGARPAVLGRGQAVPEAYGGAAADAFTGVAHSVEGMSGTVGMAGFFGIPILGWVLNKVAGVGGFIGKGVPFVGGAITKTANVAAAPIHFAERSLGEITGGSMLAGAMDTVMYKPFAAAGKMFNQATGGLLESRAMKHMATFDSHAMSAMASANQLAGAHTHCAMLPEIVSAAISSKDVSGLSKHIQEVSTHVSKPMKTLLAGVEKSASKAVKYGLKADGLNNMAHGVSDAAAAIKKTSAVHVGANLAFVAGGAASTYLTAKDINSDMHAYADMLSDLTGKPAKQFGMFDMFIGNVPYAAKVARNAMLLNAGPRTIAEAANTVLNLKQLKGGFSGALMATSLLLPMASQGIGLLTGSVDNILDAYKEMKKNELQGEQNTPDHYARLIGLASPELAKVGGANSDFTKAIAEIYAQQNVSVRDVLRAVETGKVMQDVNVLQAKFMDAKAHEASAPETSHVEALAKKREIPELRKTPREALGAHTHSVIQEAQTPHMHGGIA
jgi:hypothetical protein